MISSLILNDVTSSISLTSSNGMFNSENYIENKNIEETFLSENSILLLDNLLIEDGQNYTKEEYKIKYFLLQNKYKALYKQYEKLKKMLLEISNILIPINSNEVILSIKEKINKIKKNFIKNNDLLKPSKNKNINIKANNIAKESNEKYITLLFKSVDNQIHDSISCKNSDKFEKIENMLYDKYPKYKKTVNTFSVNGNVIKSHKSIKENNIKDLSIIKIFIDEKKNVNNIND